MNSAAPCLMRIENNIKISACESVLNRVERNGSPTVSRRSRRYIRSPQRQLWVAMRDCYLSSRSERHNGLQISLLVGGCTINQKGSAPMSRTFTNLLTHLVFSTKGREPLIRTDMKDE